MLRALSEKKQCKDKDALQDCQQLMLNAIIHKDNLSIPKIGAKGKPLPCGNLPKVIRCLGVMRSLVVFRRIPSPGGRSGS